MSTLKPRNAIAYHALLDEYMKKYKLQDQDWRKQKPWYKPS